MGSLKSNCIASGGFTFARELSIPTKNKKKAKSKYSETSSNTWINYRLSQFHCEVLKEKEIWEPVYLVFGRCSVQCFCFLSFCWNFESLWNFSWIEKLPFSWFLHLRECFQSKIPVLGNQKCIWKKMKDAFMTNPFILNWKIQVDSFELKFDSFRIHSRRNICK